MQSPASSLPLLPSQRAAALRRKRGGVGKSGGGKVGFVGGDGLDQIPPGKVPGVPEIAHVGGGYIQLLWAPPISVGSHSLSGYEICAREGGDRSGDGDSPSAPRAGSAAAGSGDAVSLMFYKKVLHVSRSNLSYGGAPTVTVQAGINLVLLLEALEDLGWDRMGWDGIVRVWWWLPANG